MDEQDFEIEDTVVRELAPAARRTPPLLSRSARTGGKHAAQPSDGGRIDGRLAGSVLSTQTWKQAFAAATTRERAAS
jgi:hypothetical protein